jgi:hypothetical protein
MDTGTFHAHAMYVELIKVSTRSHTESTQKDFDSAETHIALYLLTKIYFSESKYYNLDLTLFNCFLQLWEAEYALEQLITHFCDIHK